MGRVWSDTERRFGPFVYDGSSIFTLGIELVSRGDDEDEQLSTSLRLFGFRRTLILLLPGWLMRPYAEKVKARSWDAATVERLGRDWYWHVEPREFGFTIHDGFISVSFGRQSYDSNTEQRWGMFLPWTQWRHVRHSFYDMDGDLFAHVPERDWEAREKLETACPVLRFAFLDFDGEPITATTRIEEREWRFGEGWFKWLSLFRRPKIRRSLDLNFSAEVGKRKGSWKGGTIGHSIDMLPGELHEDAFRRYCAQNNLTFISATGDTDDRT